MKSWFIRNIVLAFCLVAFAACQFRPLDDPNNKVHLTVLVNTDSISNVTCDIYNPSIQAPKIDPKTMRVLFYKPSGDGMSNTYIKNATVNEDGKIVIDGDVYVNPGDYCMLVYNFDTENIKISGDENYGSIEASTDMVSEAIKSRFATKASDEETKAEILGSDIYYEPEHVVVARDEQVNIPYHQGTYEITMDAYSVVSTYYLQIAIKGAEYFGGAQAVLSGLSSGNLLGQNSMVNLPEASVYFTLQKSKDGDTDVIATIFNTFGKIPESESNLNVTFNVTTSYGSTLQKTYPIDSVFHTKNAIEHHWLLLRDTLEIPKPDVKGADRDGSGWYPEVEDWDSEEVTIGL